MSLIVHDDSPPVESVQARTVDTPKPHSALVDMVELIERGRKLYTTGIQPGSSIGFPTIDPYYTVAPGQWTVVTGIPGSGKSEFLDMALVNLAERDDQWEFGLYSPENYPQELHLIKLIEKRVRKPFSPGPSPRMTVAEYNEAAIWVAEHFFWIDPALKTPDQLIETGLGYRQRGKKFGIVLDPWNTLDHSRGGMNETDYVSLVLTDVTRMTRSAMCHVWLVVHPTKLQRERDGKRPVPTPYDISGSAHWFNKADNIICVHRPDKGELTQDVLVLIQKIRHKNIGKVGEVTLLYDRVTGRYFEYPYPRIGNDLLREPL